MKKLFFGLIATLMLSFHSYGQCEVAYSDYGDYHNEGLSLYYDSGVKTVSFAQVIDDVTKLMQKKHPDCYKSVDNSKVKALMANYDWSKVDFKTFWNENKKDFSQKYGLPLSLQELVDKMVNNSLKYDESLKLITDFKNQKDLTADELKGITVFESIFTSSNTYWNNSPHYRPGSAAIFADGVVGLIFCYGGPFAYFAGTAASLIVNESEP